MTLKYRVAICLALAAGVTNSSAQEQVIASGCPTLGIEDSCLISKQGNISYDISAARPRPRVGYMAIRLSATKSSKLGICQQGVILEDIQWSYTNERCE
jgi:hypothetical protein